MVAQRLNASLSPSADEKQVRTLSLLRTLRHHVIVHRLQRFRLMEIHHSFCPRFRSYSFRMVGAEADRDPASSVGDVFGAKVENFTWSQSTMEHEEKHGLVSLETQRCDQCSNLLIGHGTRYPLNGFDMDSSANRSLPGGPAHERTMVVRDARIGGIVYFQDGIFLVRKLLRNNQILVEGGNSSKDAVDGRRSQPCRWTPLIGRAEDQSQSLSLSFAGTSEQVLQK